jgi:hypothetical protein
LTGPFTGRGLERLTVLSGLSSLSFFRHASELTPRDLAPLSALPNLQFFGCSGELCNDEAMRSIAAIPRLRMLLAQGMVATDDGFAALARSRTLEYVWGRECPNLQSRGFAALARMPALRGLAVSCQHVDDSALAELPRSTTLTELLPMDVGDEGFRHVGQCAGLESLWCMYCRDTTDRATEHIVGLPRLKRYYAGASRITDRSLELLSRMPTLERVENLRVSGRQRSRPRVPGDAAETPRGRACRPAARDSGGHGRLSAARARRLRAVRPGAEVVSRSRRCPTVRRILTVFSACF